MNLNFLLLNVEPLIIVNKMLLVGLMLVKIVKVVMYTNIPIINYILMNVYRIIQVIVMLVILNSVIYVKKDTFWIMTHNVTPLKHQIVMILLSNIKILITLI